MTRRCDILAIPLDINRNQTYSIDDMKIITKSVIFIFVFALVALSFGEAARERPERHGKYPRRRFYTKRINVLDQSAAEGLKVPDPEKEDKRGREGLQLDGDAAPLVRDVSTSTRHQRMPGPRRSEKRDKADSDSWIVKALLDVDSEDKIGADQEEEEETLGADWGWLARDSGLLGGDNSANRDGMESAESIELEAEEMRILRELLLNGDAEEPPDGTESSSNRYATAGQGLFVDFEEEARKRFEIFRSFNDDANQIKSAEEDSKPRDEKPEMAGDMELDSDIDQSNPARSSQNATFLERYRNIDLAASKAPGRMDEFEKQAQAIQPPRSFSPGIEQNPKFKSAFDSGSESKFKSPFESKFNSGSVTLPGNSGYDPPGPGSRFEPIGGDRAYAQPRARDFGRIESRDLPDTIRESRKKLPYSIRQWD